MQNTKFKRRSFLKTVGMVVGGSMLTIKGISAKSFQIVDKAISNIHIPFTRTSEKKYVKKGKEIGIGTAEIISDNEILVSSWETVKIRYIAGKAGIKPGGAIRFTLMHLHRWIPFQNDNPKAPAYVTATSSNGAPIKIKCFINRSWKEILSSKEWRLYDPYYNYLEFKLLDSGLKPGDSITIILGDRTFGSKGVFTQYYTENKFRFETYVNPDGGNIYYPFADKDHPTVTLVNQKPFKISVIAPTNAIVGKEISALIRVEDKYGNPVRNFNKTIELYNQKGNKRIGSYKFLPSDSDSYRYNGISFDFEGVMRLKVRMNDLTAVSNPIAVTKEEPLKKIYWGDIHNHTRFSDGRGNFQESYKHGRDFAGLDFCAVTDHAQNLKDDEWELCKKVTNSFNKPGEFVTFHAYEWSGKEDVGGDHNVYFYDEDIPIYRSRANFNYINFNSYQGQAMQMNHIEDLYISLMQHFNNKNIMVIPHYGGRHANPEWHYPVLERQIEIFSDHRRSEDWVTKFLTRGYHLGIMASSDNHVGKPGYSITFPRSGSQFVHDIDWKKEEIGTSLIATYAPELTREHIFEAMYDRHSYATTGERIILEFTVNNRLMGSEIKSQTIPTIRTKVIGTNNIDLIEIKRDSQVVHSIRPDKLEVEFEWKDNSFKPNDKTYYYVRVVQNDNEEAVSSPVWIN